MMQAHSVHKGLSKVVRRIGESLSEEASIRLGCIQLCESLRKRGFTLKEACELMKISQATFYRWLKRYKTLGLYALEPKSKKPKQYRFRRWSKELIETILTIRQEFPVWGKNKVIILVRQAGFKVSESTVGRILAELVKKGRCLKALAYSRRNRQRKAAHRFHAQRIKYKLQPRFAGEGIQIDSMSLGEGGRTFKQFTATCPISKWTIVDIYPRATSKIAAQFLQKCIREMPFPIRGIQVDGGSEFMKYFEEECANQKIPLYVLPPRSPKLNGNVERVNGLCRREFYEVYDLPDALSDMRLAIAQFQNAFNYRRPHFSLKGLTPAQALYDSLNTGDHLSYVLN